MHPAKTGGLFMSERALRFACAVGSRVCTRLGAVAALPTKAEADRL